MSNIEFTFDFTNNGDYLFIEGSAYMMHIEDGGYSLAFSSDGMPTAAGYVEFDNEGDAKARLLALHKAELDEDEVEQARLGFLRA